MSRANDPRGFTSTIPTGDRINQAMLDDGLARWFVCVVQPGTPEPWSTKVTWARTAEQASERAQGWGFPVLAVEPAEHAESPRRPSWEQA